MRLCFFYSRKSLAPIPEVESELEEEDEDIDADMLKSSKESEDREGKYGKNTAAGTVEKPEANVHTINGFLTPKTNGGQKFSDSHSKGWQTIPKPKGHSRLDYSRWDSVEDGSSDDDYDEEDEYTRPQYKFRVNTVDVRPVK